MNGDHILESARTVVRMEREALELLEGRLGGAFVDAVQLLAGSSGRVIVTGVGKSGLIGRKIAATLTSTGTPAAFLHPVDSQHGDIGLVGAGDVGLLLSKSGRSEELLVLLELLKRMGVRTIAITGEMDSPLARDADVALDASVDEEACPHNLAPTTSTTAALALGDALAVALLQVKGFRAEDFARLHPGGSLGRRLLTRVRDVMLTDRLPVLQEGATMRQAVVELAERRGIAVFTDGSGQLKGVLTAGDLTRMMEKVDDILSVPVAEVMTRAPRTCGRDELGSAVVYRMETQGIMSMPVVDEENRVLGVVHLHDLMRAGAA